MPKFLQAIAAIVMAIAVSFGSAEAAQHQSKAPTTQAISSMSAPVKVAEKRSARQSIVVAQNRRARRARRGVRRGVRRSNRRRRNRRRAAGAAAAIIGLGVAAAIANQSRAEGYYEEDEGRSWRRRCRRLRWRCDDGSRWACRRYWRDCR